MCKSVHRGFLGKWVKIMIYLLFICLFNYLYLFSWTTTGQTRRRIFTLDGAVVSRGPFNNQGVMWLRTYLFNHNTISFSAIFHSSSNSQILDFSLPFASDDCLYAFTPKRTFIIFHFNFWFNFQAVFVSSLRKYCNLFLSPLSTWKFSI